MRPKKERLVRCPPGERRFVPLPKSAGNRVPLCLTLDEMEAMRLADFERLEQEEVARRMQVHRSTVSRILDSARHKIAEALVQIRPFKIEGGCCKLVTTGKSKRVKTHPQSCC